MMKEQWKPVVGYEGNYEVSNLGRVKSLPRNGTIKKERIIKNNVKKSGYVDIMLSKNNKRIYTHLHRVVAKAFIPNPENKPQVNHKDGNKQNNTVENLEWATASENLKHKYAVLGVKAGRYCVKNVMCVETKEVIDGIKKAERMFNIKRSGIHHAIKRNGTAGGYHWVIV